MINLPTRENWLKGKYDTQILIIMSFISLILVGLFIYWSFEAGI